MLDEADFRARYDKDDALGVLAGQPEQLRHEFARPEGLGGRKVAQIVMAGMGGSALGGELARNWLGDRLAVPLELVRDYTLPAYAGPETLVVCVSYSGGSEETLAAYAEARKRKAQVVVMASGGKLLEAARADGVPGYELPSEVQGRYGVLYGLRAWAQLLETVAGLEGLVDELEEASGWVRGEVAAWLGEVPAETNEAKQIAAELLGHGVVVYGGLILPAITLKWKLDLNENAKNVAFWNNLPEMNHNEFSGWGHPRRPGLKVVELTSSLDHSQVQKRFEAMNSLLSSRFAPIEVRVQGETKLRQMLWAYMLGSMTSAYLGMLNQVEIGTLPLVGKLKERLT
jgi:glucose/mannose-6-phosphate isomerase